MENPDPKATKKDRPQGAKGHSVAINFVKAFLIC